MKHEQLKIRANGELNGEIIISGAKNAALPLMCASLLTDEALILENTPMLSDVDTLCEVMKAMGTQISCDGVSRLELKSDKICCYHAPYEYVVKMRASILVLGPTLARFGQARVSMPGGCQIGSRPVDEHIKGLQALGAQIEVVDGDYYAKAEKLTGARIVMGAVSVTGTENIVMAAVLAEGTTIIENAAMEPEVTDLIECLNKMGAKITGSGTPILTIEGVKKLHGTTHSIIPDRIEAGTFLCAVAMTGGKIRLNHAAPQTMGAILDKIHEAGVLLECGDSWIVAEMHSRPRAVDINTYPYPAFPTDMQAQFIALNAIADGNAQVTENLFENRFMHVPELNRMGANISVKGKTAVIDGTERLSGGATVQATDLRASACLVIAGLVTENETTINRIDYLDRGYDHIERKLQAVGAKIERVSVCA